MTHKNEIGGYKKLHEIATGSFGSVVSVYQKGDGKKFAGKHIDPTNYPRWEQEKMILKDYANEDDNVIVYFDVEVLDGIILLMELCDGTVEQYICDSTFTPLCSDKKQAVNPRDYFDITPLDVAQQSAAGMKYLHIDCDIIHGDVKPSNFLLVKSKTKKKTLVKVCDFGLSRRLKENQSGVFSLSAQNALYAAPECYDEKAKKRRSSDIFSLGIFFYYVLTNGKHPFGGCIVADQSRTATFEHIRENRSRGDFTQEQIVCAVHLMKRMIKMKEHERISIEDVTCHPLFWDSKKKVDFYKSFHSHFKGQSWEKDFNQVRKDLLTDGKTGTEQIRILPDHLPEEIRYDLSHAKAVKTYRMQNFIPKNLSKETCDEILYGVEISKIVKSYTSIRTVVRFVRNMEAHLLDANTPPKVRKCLGVSGFRVDWNIFLSKLTGRYPQLLMHLYDNMPNVGIIGEFYLLKSDVPKKTAAKKRQNACRSPIGTSQPQQEVAQTNKRENHLEELRVFMEEQNIPKTDFFKYQITVKYGSHVVVDSEVCAKSAFHVFYPNKEAEMDFGIYSPVKLPLCDVKELPEASRKDMLTILNNFCPGLKFRGQIDFTLLVERCSKVQVFRAVASSWVKLNQTEAVPLFSYTDLWSHLVEGTFVSKASRNVSLSVGKDPSKTSPLLELELSPILPDALEQLIREKQQNTGVVLSLS